MPRPRTGLLIIRAWTEPGSDAPLRAHIRRTDELGVTSEHSTTLTDPGAVGTVLQEWLQGVLADEPGPPSD